MFYFQKREGEKILQKLWGPREQPFPNLESVFSAPNFMSEFLSARRCCPRCTRPKKTLRACGLGPKIGPHEKTIAAIPDAGTDCVRPSWWDGSGTVPRLSGHLDPLRCTQLDQKNEEEEEEARGNTEFTPVQILLSPTPLVSPRRRKNFPRVLVSYLWPKNACNAADQLSVRKSCVPMRM